MKKENKESKKKIELLENELYLLIDNIERLKAYQQKCEKRGFVPYNSLVVGEIKHRMTALKQRLTICSKITTGDLL
mgnify:CR=1 FL=1